MAAAALGLGVSRRVECCRCIILHSNYRSEDAAGSWEVFATELHGPEEEVEEETGFCEEKNPKKTSMHGRVVMSTVVGRPAFSLIW